jgi:hypothetical protein
MPTNSRTIRNTGKTPVVVNIPTADDIKEDKRWIDPKDNPEQTNAMIEKLLSDSSSSSSPEIKFPENDTVILPAGLLRKDGVVKTVEVKELTGEDEEALAKASQSVNPFSFLDRLLRCGVSRIGDSTDEKLLGNMVIGDREAIILGIRKATYGEEINILNWTCPDCSNKADLSFSVDDIPVVKLADASDSEFTVPLRKGGHAKVRLATGNDQLAIFEKPDLTEAQRDTVLLSRCVVSVTDVHGSEKLMSVFPSMSRSMSIPDRHAILRELGKRQPGPKYDQVKFDCENCKKEQNVMVTIGNLFLDFGWN